MSETSKIPPKDSDLKEPRNPFSFIPNLNLQWPFPSPEKSVAGEVQQQSQSEVVAGESESSKPMIVRFPKAQIALPSPVAVENVETGKTSNPIILWQVYALGGYLVLRWVWARWNERNGSNERSTGSDDDRDSAE